MKMIYKIKYIVILIGLIAILLSGCCEDYVSSEMKFSTEDLPNGDALQITSSSPGVPIAGNEDRIVYIDLEGNIVCYDCATDTERILVRATSSDDYYSAGTYSSIVLDGNKVYYRFFGLGQWDTIYCVDVDSCQKQKIGRTYMDSFFYVQDGNVYSTEYIDDQLSSVNNPFDEYYFNDHDRFITFDSKVYQQMRSKSHSDIVIFSLESKEMDIIPFSDNAKLFYSNQNNIYYATDTEFGEIIEGAAQKIIDLKDFDISYGYTNIQMIGGYIVIGNDCGNYIYNKNTNSLEAFFYGGMGPYNVNGELIYRFDSASYSYHEFFTDIGQGYYSLNIEKAIEEKIGSSLLP